MSVQIKKNGVWEAVAGNATNTSGITESSALANLGTAANATQHDINVAINDAMSNVIPTISEIDLGNITINAGSFLTVNLATYGINTHGKPWLAFIYNRSHFTGSISLIGDGASDLLIYNNNTSNITGTMTLAILHSPA